jgi:signal transduction histidine kinase
VTPSGDNGPMSPVDPAAPGHRHPRSTDPAPTVGRHPRAADPASTVERHPRAGDPVSAGDRHLRAAGPESGTRRRPRSADLVVTAGRPSRGVDLVAAARRHPGVVDSLIAAVVAGICSLILSGLTGATVTPARPLDWVLIVLVAAPLAARRRAPVLAFWTVAVLFWTSLGIGAQSPAGFLVPLVALHAVARYRPPIWAVTAACFVIPPGFAARLDRTESWKTLFALVAVSTTVTMIGLSQRTRQAYLAALEDRAERLERDRDQRARLAVAEERARIAREMHDVVAHHLTVMTALSEGAAATVPSDPSRAATVMTQAAATGREALSDMRRLLGVLRSPTDPGTAALTGQSARAGSGPEHAGPPGASRSPAPSTPLTPQPGLADLDALLNRVRAAGPQVTVTREGAPGHWGPAAGLAVYRIVQEALTNTLKHAGPRAEIEVALRFAPDRADLDIRDTTQPTGPATAKPPPKPPATTERAAAGPTTAGPASAEPALARPPLARPPLAEPTGAEPTGAEPTGAEPTGAEPTLPEPPLAGPPGAGPTGAGPTEAHAGRATSTNRATAQPHAADRATAQPHAADWTTAQPPIADRATTQPPAADRAIAEIARPPTAIGHGLAGMAERVAAYGGEITAGPRHDRAGWRVQARLHFSEPGPIDEPSLIDQFSLIEGSGPGDELGLFDESTADNRSGLIDETGPSDEPSPIDRLSLIDGSGPGDEPDLIDGPDPGDKSGLIDETGLTDESCPGDEPGPIEELSRIDGFGEGDRFGMGGVGGGDEG